MVVLLAPSIREPRSHLAEPRLSRTTCFLRWLGFFLRSAAEPSTYFRPAAAAYLLADPTAACSSSFIQSDIFRSTVKAEVWIFVTVKAQGIGHSKGSRFQSKKGIQYSNFAICRYSRFQSRYHLSTVQSVSRRALASL